MATSRDITDAEFAEAHDWLTEYRAQSQRNRALVEATMPKQIPATDTRISHNEIGENFICVCGNNELSSGFVPCNERGVEVEPDRFWRQLLVCAECGLIVDTRATIIGYKS